MKSEDSLWPADSTGSETVHKEHGSISTLSKLSLKSPKFIKHLARVLVVVELGQLYVVEFHPHWDLTLDVAHVQTGHHLRKSLKADN